MSEFKLTVMAGGEHLADALGDIPPEGVDSTWWAEHLAGLRAEPGRLHPVEMEIGVDGVRRLLRDPDLAADERARAEAFLAAAEG
jgi:hypothetical protein